MSRKPKLVVFDLDYTLWPFWVDTHVDPPFAKKGDTVYDRRGKAVRHYPEVPTVLEHLTSLGHDLAVASRTGEIEGAKQLIDLFGWTNYFKYREIYPGSKTTHFKRLKEAAKVDYADMIFFDDEERNIRDIVTLGSSAILVNNGMTMKVLEGGLAEFGKRKG